MARAEGTFVGDPFILVLSDMHFLELLFVSWEVEAGESGKCSCPCGRGKSQPFHLLIYLFNSQMEVCVTWRYLQQLHYHIILLISSVCVW